VRRTLELADPRTLDKIARVRGRVRAHVWELIAAAPAGFPWLSLAGKLLAGWLVIDLDATLITAHSEKQGAAPTFKKGYGLLTELPELPQLRRPAVLAADRRGARNIPIAMPWLPYRQPDRHRNRTYGAQPLAQLLLAADLRHQPRRATDHPAANLSQQRIHRRPVLGGLINEYERAA
jgi:hypothetical protein